jgi:hypothetical protein
MTPDEIKRRASEVGLPNNGDDHIILCGLCKFPVWYRDSWSPGDDMICSTCDTEVTGRKHPPRLDPKVDPPPADAYPELYPLKHTAEDDVEELKLLEVSYGADYGLVSLRSESLLFSTWDTNHCTANSSIPRVSVDDGWAFEFFGEEHNWNDVISMLRKCYDWETKTLHLPKKEKEESDADS